MSSKNSKSEYHKLIRDTASKETKSYFKSDWRAWATSIISAFVGGAFVFLVTWVLEGSGMTLSFFIQTIAIFAGAFLGYLAAYFFVFSENLISSVPARLYREMEVKANKFSWEDIFFECIPFPENSPASVGIYVKSVKPSLLKGINANIVSIEHKGQDILDKRLPLPILNSDKKFDWGATDIEFSKSKSFVLLKSSLREGMREYSDTLELFIPAEGSQPDNFEPAQYFEEYNKDTLPVYVTIEFHGSVDGHAIYPDKRLVYRVDCVNNKPVVELAGES